MVTGAVLGALAVTAVGAPAAEAPLPKTLGQNVARTFTAAGDRAGSAVAIERVLGPAPSGGEAPGTCCSSATAGAPGDRRRCRAAPARHRS